MFLKSTFSISGKKFFQCAQLNITLLCKSTKFFILKRHSSLGRTYERGKKGIHPPFLHTNVRDKISDIGTEKKVRNWYNIGDIRKKKLPIQSGRKYTCKYVRGLKGNPSKNILDDKDLLEEEAGRHFGEEIADGQSENACEKYEKGYVTYENDCEGDEIDTARDAFSENDTARDAFSENDKSRDAFSENDTARDAFCENDTAMEEDGEEFEDDIDALLYTNNLNSSLIGNLWHASANSIYEVSHQKSSVSKERSIKGGTSRIYQHEGDNIGVNEASAEGRCVEEKWSKEKQAVVKERQHVIFHDLESGKKGNGGNEEETPYMQDSIKCFSQRKSQNCAHSLASGSVTLEEGMESPKGNVLSNAFINKIYEEERKEEEKMKEYFEKNEHHFMKYRNSILCKLNISKELPKRFKHLSKDTSTIFNKEKNREEHYKKILNSLSHENYKEEYCKEKKKKNKNVNYDKMETIKVLDIDSLPCNVLNNLFAYKIVKNCSAELCLKIISRIGMYRDKYSQVSYENMINYLGQIINSNSNAEIIALFARCYETVSIPFLVNYVRKYGTFSRSFIVNLYDKYFRRRLFDFVRYEHNMGIRKIPNILTHPYHLSSYIKLLGECSAKKDMYIQLKMRGYIPDSPNFNDEKKIDKINFLMDEINNNKKIKKINIHNEKKKSRNNKLVERPKMYDIILSAEYTGLPVEHFIEKEKVRQGISAHSNLSTGETLPGKCHNVEKDDNCEVINEICVENENESVIHGQSKEKRNVQDYTIVKKNIVQDSDNVQINDDFECDHTDGLPTLHCVNNGKITNEKTDEQNVNFILGEDCDIYLYKQFNRLNTSSFKLQTTLVKSEEKTEKELTIYSRDHEQFKYVEGGEKSESLWELPWKGTKKNAFFFKGRFFKILPNVGWSEIKDISNKYVRPKRKRTKHFIRRKRVLQKKIKIELFKKKVLEK
ncbi:conserved Plasmodium protein, unknown function [Plasmodium ovale]|uniref:Uncharacterized protein n=2 Tax=Plasmodium ovale TaxID=36330 RepID=A0A1A8WZ09_PLAOA|nr:conserved Plasmodium protein, unknown function [Plasmodium ovale curtisi]SBS98213.1 conserved Plasmodium protein, unknown function [Plasmodium ovale curtisi]SCQ16940.1 conserved Plasmodium protein, unknown function [Plasmodium ovale]